MRRLVTTALVLALAAPLSGCASWLASLDASDIPSYVPREVLIPESCSTLIQRAAEGEIGTFSDAEARELGFCQQQHLIRAQEEEAMARKIQAHSSAATFALRLTTVVIGGVVAVLAWVF